MDKINKTETSGLTLARIAWVVKDIEKLKTFFQEMSGIWQGRIINFVKFNT